MGDDSIRDAVDVPDFDGFNAEVQRQAAREMGTPGFETYWRWTQEQPLPSTSEFQRLAIKAALRLLWEVWTGKWEPKDAKQAIDTAKQAIEMTDKLDPEVMEETLSQMRSDELLAEYAQMYDEMTGSAAPEDVVDRAADPAPDGTAGGADPA